ncbi:MFS transporter [Cereibacter azotoformans]|uniref:Sugar phosphate permease n=1 Tax=Cereibacter azotoformans TaxID=43057 RepID=A0A2T5K6F6_9RHOB|nr:MFS transporter [Cereibacter azotoformans]AXQ95182.1 MFS transporter [Cereibacter sphaeroides]PTR18006.1 sugar phosphate permease [Cereibacter azotoformans]UIJ32605.1 MFS transporter [Cereibacter azotoformans]
MSGNRWAFLAVACAALVLSLSTWFSATAVMPELVARWSLGPSEAAWLTNGVQAGFVIGALASSVLGLPDRLHPNRLMAGAAALAGASTLILLLEPGPAAAIAARLVTGIALAGVYPPAIRLMATWFLRGRGLALGCLIGALTLGSALPHLVRGVGEVLDWRLVIAAAGLFSLTAAPIFGLALRDGPHPFGRAGRVDLRQTLSILRNRPVMAANLGYFGHMWELYAMWGWFLAWARAASEAGLGLGNLSLLTFAVLAAGAPGCVLGGLLSDRIGRCRTTALALGVSGCCALAIGLAWSGPAWLLVGLALLWGLAVVADSAQFSAAVTELSPPHLVGSALAFQMGVGFALTIFTIWALPLLAGIIGWRWVFLALVPGPFLGAWSMLALRRMPEAAGMAHGMR